MSITFEATYENGVLKPKEPLPLREHDKVTVTIQPAQSVARQTAGMVLWIGNVDVLDHAICDPEFGILESP